MMLSCIGLVACLGLGLVFCQDMNNNKAYHDPLLSGLIFTDNLLFERSVTSKIRCASLCLKTDQCVTFTFTPVTSADDVCRGHSARMALCKAHESSAGTKLYAFPEAEEDWVGTLCSSNQDCRQPCSRCRRGECTCTQGYYYSVSTKACLDSCSPGDLQDTYLPFPDGVTIDSTVGYTNVSLEACRQACTYASNCLSFERRDSDNYCGLESVNPRDKAPSVWHDDQPGFAYYQKNCR